jgi:hypothetical protein
MEASEITTINETVSFDLNNMQKQAFDLISQFPPHVIWISAISIGIYLLTMFERFCRVFFPKSYIRPTNILELIYLGFSYCWKLLGYYYAVITDLKMWAKYVNKFLDLLSRILNYLAEWLRKLNDLLYRLLSKIWNLFYRFVKWSWNLFCRFVKWSWNLFIDVVRFILPIQDFNLIVYRVWKLICVPFSFFKGMVDYYGFSNLSTPMKIFSVCFGTILFIGLPLCYLFIDGKSFASHPITVSSFWIFISFMLYGCIKYFFISEAQKQKQREAQQNMYQVPSNNNTPLKSDSDYSSSSSPSSDDKDGECNHVTKRQKITIISDLIQKKKYNYSD